MRGVVLGGFSAAGGQATDSAEVTPGCVLIELLGERWQWGAHGKDAELVPDSLVKLHRGSMAGIHLHSVRSLAYLKWDRESSMLGLWSLCCFSSVFILGQNKVVVSQGNLPFNLA